MKINKVGRTKTLKEKVLKTTGMANSQFCNALLKWEIVHDHPAGFVRRKLSKWWHGQKPKYKQVPIFRNCVNELCREKLTDEIKHLSEMFKQAEEYLSIEFIIQCDEVLVDKINYTVTGSIVGIT